MSFQVGQQTEQGDPTLPTYTATDEEALLSRIRQTPGVDLPILHIPTQEQPSRYANPEWTDEEYHRYADRHRLQVDVVVAFFEAIERGLDDIAERFISTGLVSPDTTGRNGETPLLAAVRVRKSGMVRKLVELGAIVDGYGKTIEPGILRWNEHLFPDRTALQLAAQTGNLAIVKILIEDYGADDSLIAPDGALALRLAAANGHREIVEYLPVRRGGAWKRWRYTHRVEMDRVRRAFRGIGEFITFFAWHMPKFFLWTVPKETTQAVTKKLASAWKRRRELGGWIKRQAIELPSRVHHAGKRVAKGVRKLPNILKRIIIRIWGYIKALPKGVKICAQWIVEVLIKIGLWIAHVATRCASFVHTIFSAIISWFRQITLKDVWNGFCSVLKSLFVDFPRFLWKLTKSFSEFAYKSLEVVFGTLGLCIWYGVAGIIFLLGYIPRKLWQSIQAIGRIMSKAIDEVIVYYNPKKV
ncbi:ankyrin repeat protein [Pochonia chlamydosporia 170]|uniref:Ankyrin repeat protein n=1 Tax=Pochonia chlamydosporia 170 TaxID=1380566 RepID=A0A179F764_METCM|nr:ankyrin repeat protein [Pochonia chlamydosporia 170]OAQ61268.1 ankyrin repeat protein [Pochonia chlamydosporia 170]